MVERDAGEYLVQCACCDRSDGLTTHAMKKEAGVCGLFYMCPYHRTQMPGMTIEIKAPNREIIYGKDAPQERSQESEQEEEEETETSP